MHGSKERLRLGNIDVQRGWGWVPEYINVMWMMLQRPGPEDFVITTGRTVALREIVRLTFAQCGLDWSDHVEEDSTFIRPTGIMSSRGDPAKAGWNLGWSARRNVEEVIAGMLAGKLDS